MTLTGLLIVGFFGLVVAINWWGLSQSMDGRGNLEKLREQFESQFRSFSATATDPRYEFQGRTATVVKDEETFSLVNYTVVSMTKARYSRNPSGEFFLFKSDGKSQPYVKHLQPDRAKLLLGEMFDRSKEKTPEPASAHEHRN